MSIEYAEDKDLTNMVDRMVTTFHEFSKLRDCGVKILSEMKIVMDDKTQEMKPCKGPPASIKKIGPAERVFIKDHAHYLLLMDWTFWNSSNEIEREKAIHGHALKKINAEKDEKGKLKLSRNLPEVSTYFDTATRYGHTMEDLAEVHQCVAMSRKTLQMVQKLDAEEAKAAPTPAAKPKAKPVPAPEPEPAPVEEQQETDAAPEPAEEDEPVPEDEEVLPPPRRVNNRASKP